MVQGEYTEVNVLKKGRPVAVPLSSLSRKYLEPVKISATKIQNVKSLLPYIPHTHHPFYNNIRSTPDPKNEREDVELIE